MKTFSYKIGFFIAILFMVNLLLFNLGNDQYYKNYDKYNLNFNSYLFSDSHGAVLKKHTQKYGVYNFSVDSDSYIDIKRKINFLIERTKLDTIYLSADEQMLSPYRERLNNTDKSSYFATINDYKKPSDYYKNQVSQKVIYFQPKMGTVLRKYLVSKIENVFNSPEINKSKIKKTELNWSEKTLKSKKVIVKNRLKNQFIYQQNSAFMEEALMGIINICKLNQITLIGVKFPITKEYYFAVDDKKFGVDSIFKMNNLNVLDFQSKYINNSDLFLDADHLNSRGGKLFADVLFKESQITIND